MNKFIRTFQSHYQLYLIEAWGLGLFMVSASLFTILLEHPAFSFSHILPSPFIRRACIGLAMGGTALGIILSPWGKRSGAHINPAVTFTMWWLRKINTHDVVFYILFQIIGGTVGVLLVVACCPDYMANPSVSYVATVPGKAGLAGAVIGEAVISFLLMYVTLMASDYSTTKKWTPYFTALLIFSFVCFEAPYSGFSMNPARTLASAIPSGIWTGWALYMVVPPLGMWLAAVVHSVYLHTDVVRKE